MRSKDYVERGKIAAFNSLSLSQRLFIEDNLDRMKRADIANAVGISESRIKRAAQIAEWSFSYRRKYSPEIVNQVLSFYEKNGKAKTVKEFPNVKAKSIVERYGKGLKKRRRPWTKEQRIELLRMAGIIPHGKQAQYFNRPMANKGSIVGIWSRFFNCRAGQVNGLPSYKAKAFIKPECPSIKTCLGNGVQLFLWVDCIKHLKADCPKFVEDAIQALSEFQLTLFKHPRREIEKIIKERG